MIPKRLVRSCSKNQSLETPPFTAVIGQMAQSFVIGLPRTARMTALADIIQMCYFETYIRNRIRFKFLTTRLGDWNRLFFFYWQ